MNAKNEDKRKTEFLVSAFKSAMSLIDHNYVYETVNEAYCKSHHRKKEDFIGKTVARVWGKEKFEKQLKKHFDLCFAGKTIRWPGWFSFPESGKKYYNVTYYPYKNKKGRITHAAVITFDDTERKIAQDKLHQYTKKLELIVQKRTKKLTDLVTSQKEFISQVGHELRTPLSVIKGLAEMSLDNKNTLTLANLELLNRKVDQITLLLSNLMLVSRLDSGYRRIKKTKFKLKNLIQEVTEDISRGHPQKSFFSIKTTCPDNLYLATDRTGLSQIITNLLSNSIKHSIKNPRITITAKQKKDFTIITVSDRNPPISKDKLKKIFQKHYQLKKTSSESGLGLGLYICNRITTLLKGKIYAESNPKGNQFTLLLPHS